MMQAGKVKTLVMVLVSLVLFSILYGWVLSIYEAESVARATVFSNSQSANPDHLAIYIKLMNIDPVKGDLSVRLQFEPNGKFVNAGAATLALPVTLDINSATGKTEYQYKKGERMNPMDIVVSVWGEATEYPFDQHTSELVLYLISPSSSKDVEDQPIPIVIDYTGALAGYRIDASEDAEKSTGFSKINMTIARSLTTVSFAFFIMVLKWLLALGALLVALSVVLRGRKVELAMFSWLAALLFALPPLRNAMPSAPPIGSLSDFLSFFWAEGIVALSLATVVFTWLRRPGAK